MHGAGIVPGFGKFQDALSSARTREQELARLPLPAFIQACGVNPSAVGKDQVLFFVAARALLHDIEKLALPTARESSTGQHEVQNPKKSHVEHVTDGRVLDGYQRPPSAVWTIGSAAVGDLPHIFPHQLCYTRKQLFYLLGNNKLMMRKMMREVPDTENSRRAEERLEEQAGKGAPSGSTPRAYVLLDVSQSMNGEKERDERRPDQRGAIARGLALAFLLSSKERGAQLHFRPFSSRVGERVTAREPRETHAIATEILELKNDGTTGLQKALDESVKDLEGCAGDTRIDVMLVTDGVSHLSKNPFQGRHLHTFLLGDACQELKDGGSGVLEKLAEWSATFERIRKRSFGDLLRPRAQDLKMYSELVTTAKNKLDRAHSIDEVAAFESLLDATQALLDADIRYDKDGGKELSAEHQRLSKEVKEGKELSKSPKLLESIAESEREFQRISNLFNAALPSRPVGRSVHGGGVEEKIDVERVTLRVSSNGGSQGSAVSLGVLVRAVYDGAVRVARRLVRW